MANWTLIKELRVGEGNALYGITMLGFSTVVVPASSKYKTTIAHIAPRPSKGPHDDGPSLTCVHEVKSGPVMALLLTSGTDPLPSSGIDANYSY
jgi:hypothetical protein